MTDQDKAPAVLERIAGITNVISADTAIAAMLAYANTAQGEGVRCPKCSHGRLKPKLRCTECATVFPALAQPNQPPAGEGLRAAEFLARFADDDTAHYIVGSGTRKRSVPVFVLRAIDAALQAPASGGE